jgi:hypothetical protein
MNPSNPTPGTADMTDYLFQAFATDINDRMRDNGKKDIRTLVEVEDIKLPEITGLKSPNETPEPEIQRLRSMRTTGFACRRRLFIMPRSGLHLGTALTPRRVRSSEELVRAKQDFGGQLVIGEDLLQLGVRRVRH